MAPTSTTNATSLTFAATLARFFQRHPRRHHIQKQNVSSPDVHIILSLDDSAFEPPTIPLRRSISWSSFSTSTTFTSLNTPSDQLKLAFDVVRPRPPSVCASTVMFVEECSETQKKLEDAPSSTLDERLAAMDMLFGGAPKSKKEKKNKSKKGF